jgi:hypothetical protein
MEGFTRPEAKVLSDDAIVPDRNLIVPPPNQFTHELVRSEVYYYSEPQNAGNTDGQLEKGTHVVLLKYDGGTYCRVADGRGLYVVVPYDSLKPLSHR